MRPGQIVRVERLHRPRGLGKAALFDPEICTLLSQFLPAGRDYSGTERFAQR
jgi:hypothetical protein